MTIPAAKLNPTYRIASLVSDIFNPLFVALPTFLLVSLHTSSNIPQGILWWTITSAGITIIPLIFIMTGVKRGKYSDHHLSIRTQRIFPMLFGICCASSVFVLLHITSASLQLLAAVAAVLIGGIVALIITAFWKISMHVTGITGSVTTLVIIFGAKFLILAPLILLIGWSRLKVNAHTIPQACAGIILSILVTSFIFKVFGVL